MHYRTGYYLLLNIIIICGCASSPSEPITTVYPLSTSVTNNRQPLSSDSASIPRTPVAPIQQTVQQPATINNNEPVTENQIPTVINTKTQIHAENETNVDQTKLRDKIIAIQQLCRQGLITREEADEFILRAVDGVK